MTRRALAAAATTAFRAFLLAGSLAGGAYAVDRAEAAETPTVPPPADTGQAGLGPAGVPEEEGRAVPAAPAPGETEIDPAAAPAGETSRDPADASPAIAAPDI